MLDGLALPSRADETHPRHLSCLDSACLDLGTGRSTIAIWLAQSRPDAHVIASDLDLAAFKGTDLPNLELRRRDLTTNDLGDAAYDLIHCRALLGFLPPRVDVLRHILRTLKPGGAFVASEMAFASIAAGTSRHWAAFWTSYLEFAAAQDWDLTFGGRLPRVLSDIGFRDVDARQIAPILNASGDTASAAEAATWSLTLATLAPKLIDGGYMTEPILLGVLAIIRNPSAWTPGPGFAVISRHRPTETTREA